MDNEHYPIVVMEDRYGGVYSGGDWMAIANASEPINATTTRAQFCLVGDDGPSGSDIGAAGFWRYRPEWIAVGGTPEEAIKALEAAASGQLVSAYVESKDSE